MDSHPRPATTADAAALRPLLDQLGYALSEAEIAARIERVAAAGDHELLVVEEPDGALAAMLHVYGRAAVEKPPEAVVQALVVRDGLRGRGLGRKLMALAENWASSHGYGHVSLSSQVDRAAAHEFYRRLGYDRYATSYHFRKTISDSGTSA
jgi:ribosomal protein S18 acetylase RimI-like enzyme